MTRLIDADRLREYYNVTDPAGTFAYCDSILTCIDNEPTVDAVPIKPLATWLAGYAAPPAYTIYGEPYKAEDATMRRVEGWEQHIRNLIECGLMEDE